MVRHLFYGQGISCILKDLMELVIVLGIVVFLVLSVFVYKSCTKKTNAEIKAQFELCLNSKMMEFKMTGENKADIDKINEIIDYCQSELK